MFSPGVKDKQSKFDFFIGLHYFTIHDLTIRDSMIHNPCIITQNQKINYAANKTKTVNMYFSVEIS